MKKRLLPLGLVLAALAAGAQPAAGQPAAQTAPGQPLSVYTRQAVSQTAIRLLLSHYGQDGTHSAVTGGQGTEALTVTAPELTVTHQPDSVQTVQVSAGVDVITSASTDRIDYVLSSASRVDYRAHLSAAYRRQLRHRAGQVGVSSGFSLESDYLSLPLGASVAYASADGARTVSVGVQAYFDDLRWGRVNPDHFRPVKLIYPVELRDRAWLDGYRRTSVNFTPVFDQVINRRLRLALYPEVAYQWGILSTPFHRVYFTDSARTVRVERLPYTRWKVPLGGQLNWFATGRVVLRTTYRFYWDSFGFTAHTAQLEAPVRVAPFLTVAPLLRLYQQTAARYFRPYAGHDPAAAYYTSDYDLAAFRSYQLALSLRYAPHQARRGYGLQAVDVRYSYYRRSDGLAAHTLALVVEVGRVRAAPYRPAATAGAVRASINGRM